MVETLNNTLTQIGIFIFLLSLTYIIKHLVELMFQLIVTDPKPIVLGKYEKILLYFAIAYTITYIIGLF